MQGDAAAQEVEEVPGKGRLLGSTTNIDGVSMAQMLLMHLNTTFRESAKQAAGREPSCISQHTQLVLV